MNSQVWNVSNNYNNAEELEKGPKIGQLNKYLVMDCLGTKSLAKFQLGKWQSLILIGELASKTFFKYLAMELLGEKPS